MSKDGGAVAALAGGGAFHRWQRPLCDQLGFMTVGGVLGGSGEPHHRRPWPPPPIYGVVRRETTNHIRVVRPRTRIQEPNWPLGQLVEIN